MENHRKRHGPAGQRNQKNYLLGVFCFITVVLVLAFILSNAPSVIRLSMAGLAGLAVVVSMVIYLYDPASNPDIKGSVIFPGGQSGGAIEVIGRPRRSSTSVSPVIREKSDSENDSDEILALLARLYEILENDDDAYRAGLDFLNDHKDEVKSSWRLSSNYARCLLLSGGVREAELMAEDMIDQFGDIGEACASAHNLLVLCVQNKTPDEDGNLRDELLDQQLDHVKKGLSKSPNRFSLLLNGMEISAEQGRIAEAADYLRRAALVDPEKARIGMERSIAENPQLLIDMKREDELQSLLNFLNIKPMDGEGRNEND